MESNQAKRRKAAVHYHIERHFVGERTARDVIIALIRAHR